MIFELSLLLLLPDMVRRTLNDSNTHYRPFNRGGRHRGPAKSSITADEQTLFELPKASLIRGKVGGK